jgi:hypothetical protein
MEPVFMILGQSAATAASLAIEADIAVQDVDYPPLKTRLLADGQILQYDAPPRPLANRTPLDSLKGIVVDDAAAALTGAWTASILGHGIHEGYQHDGDARDGKSTAVFRAVLPAPGKYDVQIAYSPNGNRATNVPVLIQHGAGRTEVALNQRAAPKIEGLFESVGEYTFGSAGAVTLSNAATDGHVIIDAVRWVAR